MDKSELPSITDLTRRLGLTPRALRYYEERGLIQATRGRGNRRRYDEPAQRRLMMIARLRDAGVELREIVGVLELIGDHEPAALQLGIRIVARRLADLDTERVQAEAAMAALLFDAG